MELSDRLEDQDFARWLSFAHALQVSLDVIRRCADDTATKMFQEHFATLPPVPRTCDDEPCYHLKQLNLKAGKRPSEVDPRCKHLARWEKMCISLHRRTDVAQLNFGNSNLNAWCDPSHAPWELAKVFVKVPVAPSCHSAFQSDATCLCAFLQYYKGSRLPPNLIERVRKARNTWAHASDQKLAPPKFAEGIRALEALLEEIPAGATVATKIGSFLETLPTDRLTQAVVTAAEDEAKAVMKQMAEMQAEVEALTARVEKLEERKERAPATVIITDFEVPSLPPHHMITDQVSKLIDTVAAENAPRVTALVGMGGVGKTVLATAVAQDARVRSAFVRVIWVQLGVDQASVNMARILYRLALLLDRESKKQWGSDAPVDNVDWLVDWINLQAATTVTQNGARLLVVAENVWHAEHLTPLMRCFDNHSRVQFVMTTRQSQMVPDDAVVERVESLALPDAVALLRKCAKHEEGAMASADEEAAIELAQLCGYLPLALAMLGASVSKRRDWGTRVASLREAGSRWVHAFKYKEQHYRHDNSLVQISAALDVSFEALADERELYECVRNCYAQLCVFPKGERIPCELLHVLWEAHTTKHEITLCVFDTSHIAGLLVDLSMLTSNSDKYYTLHELQADFAHFNGCDAIEQHHEDTFNALRKWCGISWPQAPKLVCDSGGNFLTPLLFDSLALYFYRHVVSRHMIGAKSLLLLAKDLIFDFNWLLHACALVGYRDMLFTTLSEALVERLGDPGVAKLRAAVRDFAMGNNGGFSRVSATRDSKIQGASVLAFQLLSRISPLPHGHVIRLLEGAQEVLRQSGLGLLPQRAWLQHSAARDRMITSVEFARHIHAPQHAAFIDNERVMCLPPRDDPFVVDTSTYTVERKISNVFQSEDSFGMEVCSGFAMHGSRAFFCIGERLLVVDLARDVYFDVSVPVCLAHVPEMFFNLEFLHISANGELAALSCTKNVLLYRLGRDTATEVRVVPTSGVCERVIGFHGDETFLVYNAESGSLRLVGATADEELLGLEAKCTYFAAAAEFLVASEGCHLHGYNLVRCERIFSVTFPWTVSSVALTSAHALCGLVNGAVAFVSVHQGVILSFVRVLSGPVGHVLMSPDEKTVMIAMWSDTWETFCVRDNAHCVCDTDTLLRVSTDEDTLYMNVLGFIAVDDENTFLVAQDAHFALCLLDADTLQLVKRETSFHGELLELVVLPAPLQHFVTVASDGTLKLYGMAINRLAEYALNQVVSRAKLLDGLQIAVACERLVHIIACREDAFEHVRTVEHDGRVRDLLDLEAGRLLVVSDVNKSSKSRIRMRAQYSVWDVQTGDCCDALAHFCQVDLLLHDCGSGNVLAVERRQDDYCPLDYHSCVLLIDMNSWTMREVAVLSYTYVRSSAVGDGAFVFGHDGGCSVLSTSNFYDSKRIDFRCSVASVHVMPGTYTRVFVGTSTSRIVECALVVPAKEDDDGAI